MATHLIQLKPMNLGTPYIEGLSSFFARTARVHHLTTRTLFDEIIYPRTAGYDPNATFKNYSTIINGINEGTRQILTILTEYTDKTDLLYLTPLPYQPVISYFGIIRECHAWCPCCYDEQFTSGLEIYDPLIWSFQDVNWCNKHNCLLHYKCRRCGSKFPRLTRFYQPGFCSHCNYWLGKPFSELDAESLVSDEHMRFCEEAIGELLEKSQTISQQLAPEKLMIGIRAAVDKFSHGSTSAFSTIVGISKSQGHYLVNYPPPKTISKLIKVSFYTGVSLSGLLQGQLEIVSDLRRSPPQRKVQKGKQVIDKEFLSAQLERALVELVPKSLDAVAKEINCTKGTIEMYCPALYEQLKSRAATFEKKQSDEEKRRRLCILESALTEYPPLSVVALADREQLPIASLYVDFPDLCKQLAERYAQFASVGADRRIAELCDAVKQAARQLHSQGIYPSKNKVVRLSGIRANIKTPKVYAAWKDILLELGYTEV